MGKVNLREYFKGIDQHLQAFIPEFDYLLADIGRIKDDQIRKDFHTYQLQVCLQMMKYIFDEGELLARYQKIFSILHELVSDQQGAVFFEQTLIYILRSTNLEEQKVIDLSKSISSKGGEIAMTTAEKLEQRGEQRGIKKGEQRGIKKGMQEGIEKGIYRTAVNMINKGVDIDIVKECTGLSDEDIQKLIEGSKK